MNKNRALVAAIEYANELKELCEKYLVTHGMTHQQVFDAFIAVEQAARPEFMRRGESHTDPNKRFYWFQRATGLTTAGGQNRLNKLLTLARPLSLADVTAEEQSQ